MRRLSPLSFHFFSDLFSVAVGKLLCDRGDFFFSACVLFSSLRLLFCAVDQTPRCEEGCFSPLSTEAPLAETPNALFSSRHD